MGSKRELVGGNLSPIEAEKEWRAGVPARRGQKFLNVLRVRPPAASPRQKAGVADKRLQIY